MDGELAPQGQGRPIGAAPGATPEGGDPEGAGTRSNGFSPLFAVTKRGSP